MPFSSLRRRILQISITKLMVSVQTFCSILSYNSLMLALSSSKEVSEQRIQLTSERDRLAVLVAETNSKIDQFRDVLKSLLGKQRLDAPLRLISISSFCPFRRFDNRREEIEAFVKASVSEVFSDLSTQSSLMDSSPRLTSQSPPPNQQATPLDSSVVNLGKSSPSPPQMTRERFQLERISAFTGLHPNYLLYELSLDPTYQLNVTDIQSKIREIEIQSGNDFLALPPLKPQALSVSLRRNPMAAAGLLKQQMLRVMGDRLVGSLILSSLKDHNEVL